MGSCGRASQRNPVILAAVTGLHAAVFLLLARAIAPPLALPPTSRDVAVVPIYLARRAPPKPERHEKSAPPKTTLSTARVPLPPVLVSPPGPAPAPVAAVPAETGEADRARLARVLRASRAGCATPHLLTAHERADCERRLADGAKLATYIPTPLPPERRAFYDAVAKAKQPFHAEPMRPGEHPVPDPQAGTNGSLAALQGANANSIPLVGCKFSFGGPGAGVVKPPHGLQLGRLPCFVAPPQGPFTVEANIRNPDAVVKKKDRD